LSRARGAIAEVTEFDWPSPEVTECPFPFYEALRNAGPVCRIPGHASNEFLVSRWQDVAYVEEHPGGSPGSR
jgi:hypothetical protein